MKPIVLFFLTFTVLLQCGPGADKNSQRRLIVSQIVGQVQVERAEAAQPAQIGMQLQVGDVVVTGADSSAAMAFPGLGVVRMGANSRLEASSFIEGTAAAPATKVDLRLTRGTLVSYVNKRDAASEYRVVTPTVIASVRGTAFLVSVDDDSSVTVAVAEGAVALTTPGSSDEVIVEKNAQIVIKDQKRIERAMIQPLSDRALNAIRQLSVFQKTSVMEYNALLDEISQSTPELRVLEMDTNADDLLEEREAEDARSGGADSVRKADSVDDSKTLKRDTEGDPLKIPPSSGYSK